MIFVNRSIPVNDGAEPELTRDQVWEGLVRKARNAIPFVAAITACRVVEQRGDLEFDREIVLRGQHYRERIWLDPPRRVIFARLEGPVLGTITNEIEEHQDGSLWLRFAFALALRGAESGPAEEERIGRTMEAEYVKAIASTLETSRRLARGEHVPA